MKRMANSVPFMLINPLTAKYTKKAQRTQRGYTEKPQVIIDVNI
jgi:hypothetical protein